MIAPLLVLTAACGGGDDESDAGTFDDVKVTGKVGEAPEVKGAKGVEVDKMTSRVITEGDGPKVAEGDNATMRYVIIQAKDAKEMGGTFETEAAGATEMNSEQDTILAPALVGKPYGTRVLIGLTGKDLGQAEGESADDTLLIVADVLSKWEPPKPTGTIADVSVSAKGDQEPKITLKKTPLVVAKTESKVITPAKGKKAETIKEGDSVSVRYVGVNGRDGKTFDSSYKSGGTVDFELKQGQMIPGFITGLVGKKMGDRVLITIPYTDAYGAAGRPDGGINGGDTLVFVVDLVKKAAPPQG
ncbi:FKBP-type peptidyl-prolyl cis-trans isomerase [Mumia zhuanghuii]|jgi:peptidylprolyl isomerase|uniref:Peptidyl-prolyl cis-trans isomerase n=1 Tax=Mumia zhuanghuii TaxID=2585211 RepID=A0A5C4M6H7_9ACTN|nr:FKBP-type peptidyl-prolyl cis-trans isomerase [Mumia zhuanghuii]TNC27503.1 FKBP-type peptidyl-prolyl cis-trans isomerase [Mumia zhuanghuii]